LEKDGMSLSDEQQKLISGLYMEMYDQLFAYGLNILRSRHQTEEAIQDAFRIACAKADSLAVSENRRGWIMNTYKYVIQNMLRSNAKISQMVLSASSVEEMAVAAPDEGLELRAACSDILKPEDYRLLEMIALKKYSILDASRELGMSGDAFYKRFQRARAKLREKLEAGDE
jgi:RNA polymerase sigma-70 factor (ECF subfamily)